MRNWKFPKTAFTDFPHQVKLGTDVAVLHESSSKEHNLGKLKKWSSTKALD